MIRKPLHTDVCDSMSRCVEGGGGKIARREYSRCNNTRYAGRENAHGESTDRSEYNIRDDRKIRG